MLYMDAKRTMLKGLNMSAKKANEALSVIRLCKTNEGFYGSAHIYKYQYWVRDMYHSQATLLRLGYKKALMQNILNTWAHQKGNGWIPPVYVTEWGAFLKYALHHKVTPINLWAHLPLRSPMLIYNVLNNTIDCTMYAIISAYEYSNATGDKNLVESLKPRIDNALEHLEGNIRRSKKGCVVGVDWRDTMTELKTDCLLSNMCLMYRVYSLMGEGRKASAVKRRVNRLFWNGRYYLSSLDIKDFDLFGTSLAVLWDIIPRGRYRNVMESFRKCKVHYGLSSMFFESERNPDEFKTSEADQYGTIWPYVSSYAIMALRKMGYHRFADEELHKLDRLRRLNEWYNTLSGHPGGSGDQLWSAAMYLRAWSRF